MRGRVSFKQLLVLLLGVCVLVGNAEAKRHHYLPADFGDRMPDHINTGGEKMILVDPNVHAFGAYDADGNRVYAGEATSGNDYCPDIHRRCHTKSGTFRIYSLGSRGCKSSIYPLGRGGAPMPYCMFFNKNQALHGSYEVHDANVSHGCVRLQVPDAEWIRFNFATIGTKVVVRPY
jgi:lipoprotein-anchoring transpeptidase ErfK/SrfK